MLVACLLDFTSFQAFACFRYFIGSVGSEDVCSGVGRLLLRPAAPGPQVGDEHQAEMLADKNFESHAAMILLFSSEDDFEVKNDKQPFVK